MSPDQNLPHKTSAHNWSCCFAVLDQSGRIHRFVASVSDRPGGIAHLTDLIAKCGCSVKDLYHERASVLEDVAVVSITATVETRDTEHAKELQNMLEQESIAYKWG